MSTPSSVGTDYADNILTNGISQAADKCRKLFRSILEAYQLDERVISRIIRLSKKTSASQSSLELDDLLDEFEQFRVWTRNLGVFAPDQSSLDYRLREAQDVKSGIVGLLKSLEGDLDALLFLIHNDREVKAQTDADSSDSLDSSSDESDFQDASSRTAYELHARLQRLPGTINKLMQIAEVIRTSNPGARAVKSARYVHYENGINVTEQFEREYLPLVLEHRYKLRTPLVSRFVKAISLRRRKFLYQAKHQKRLAYPGEHDDGPLRLNAMDNTRKTLPGSLPTTQSKAMETGSSQKGRNESNILTVATSYKKLQVRKTAPSTIMSASTKTTSANLEIPPPPPIPERAAYFQCPYCCILLDRRKFLVGRGTFSMPRWQRHVLADLQPYACLEDDCPTPNVQLETQEEWLNHQKWEHAMEWWCEGNEVDHQPVKFNMLDEFVEHAQQSHGQTYQSAVKQASTAGRPSMIPFSACPFCDFDALATIGANKHDDLARSLEAQNALQKHICDELVGIFLIALPERDDIKDVDTETGRPAAQGSTVLALEDIVPSFLDDNDREHSATGSGQFPLEFELSLDPYDVRIEGPDVTSWDDIWESPQLQECVRSTYTGVENDPHLQEMLAVATRDELAGVHFEKWIPTLLLEGEGEEDVLVLLVGRRVSDHVRGYGIVFDDEMANYDAWDPDFGVGRLRKAPSRMELTQTDEVALAEEGKTSWANFFLPTELAMDKEYRDNSVEMD